MPGDRKRKPDFAWQNDHDLTLETGDASRAPIVTVASGFGALTADIVPVQDNVSERFTAFGEKIAQ